MKRRFECPVCRSAVEGLLWCVEYYGVMEKMCGAAYAERNVGKSLATADGLMEGSKRFSTQKFRLREAVWGAGRWGGRAAEERRLPCQGGGALVER